MRWWMCLPQSLYDGEGKSIDIATRFENMPKNRFVNICVCKCSRVVPAVCVARWVSPTQTMTIVWLWDHWRVMRTARVIISMPAMWMWATSSGTSNELKQHWLMCVYIGYRYGVVVRIVLYEAKCGMTAEDVLYIVTHHLMQGYSMPRAYICTQGVFIQFLGFHLHD